MRVHPFRCGVPAIDRSHPACAIDRSRRAPHRRRLGGRGGFEMAEEVVRAATLERSLVHVAHTGSLQARTWRRIISLAAATRATGSLQRSCARSWENCAGVTLTLPCERMLTGGPLPPCSRIRPVVAPLPASCETRPEAMAGTSSWLSRALRREPGGGGASPRARQSVQSLQLLSGSARLRQLLRAAGGGALEGVRHWGGCGRWR